MLIKRTSASGRQRHSVLILFWKTAQRKIQDNGSKRWKQRKADTFPELPTLAQALAIGFAETTIYTRMPRHVFNPMDPTVLLALSTRPGFGGPIRSGPAFR